MSQTGKEKNKNSYGGAKKQKLLYPENQAFIDGETKELVNREEALKTIKASLGARGNSWLRVAGIILFWAVMIVLLTIGLPIGTLRFMWAISTPTVPSLLLYSFHCWRIFSTFFALLLGFCTAYIGLKTTYRLLKYSQEDVIQAYVRLLREGICIEATAFTINGSGLINAKGKNRLEYTFRSPQSGKVVRGEHYTPLKNTVARDETFTVLYLNDKIHVPL